MTSPRLVRYLSRIGVRDALSADVSTLRRLHASHVAAIPFENLDILLGRGISLDIEALADKLLGRRRGGYCFEQNTLFLTMLRELGFEAQAMEARVRAGATALRPRTHMVVVVTIDGEAWLADVGFGGDGLLEPVRMSGEELAAGGAEHRVVEEERLRVLQMRKDEEWLDQYAFLPEPVFAIDFELANWYTSTHPDSPFVRTLTAQRTTADARYILRYPKYLETRGGRTSSRLVARHELLPLLRDVFLIELPEDTRFPVIEGALQLTADS